MSTLWGPITERVAHDVRILDVSSRGLTLTDDGGRLLAKIRELVNHGSVKILLNLVDVHYIDSDGFGEIAQGFKAARDAGGELALCNVVPRIRHLLVVTKFDALIHSDESEQQAVERLSTRV